MGKKRRDVSTSLRDSWIDSWKLKESNGQYEAFIRTFDISSSGIKSRYPCPNTDGRFYQTLSLNETFKLIHLLRDPTISEIKEQYAVEPVARSVAFAEELGIKHPKYPGCSTYIVITWDFLCKTISGSYKVISVKPQSVINNKRTRELLTLERTLAISMGYEYELALDVDLKTTETQNYIKASLGAKLAQHLSYLYLVWLPNFLFCLSEHEDEPLLHSIKESARVTGMGLQDAYRLMLHAYWVGDISSDPMLALLPEFSPWELGVTVNA
tara:strand:- start:7646 stop:8452 length:807 start_codon:yes stop_codon:yes gene_type:complete